MEDMKVFVLDSRKGKNIEKMVKSFSENKNLNIELNTLKYCKNLPKDKDIYFIHYSDLSNLDEIERLRKNQPYSYFVLRTGNGHYFPKEVKRIFHESYFDIKEDYVQEIMGKFI
jgi:hypothetical protein